MPRSSNLLRAYIVLGNNEIKRSDTVSHLKKYVKDSLAAFNLDEMDARGDLEPQTLKTSLEALPVGDKYRLVIVHDAQKLSSRVQKMLLDYLDNPNEGSVLLLDASVPCEEESRKKDAFVKSKLYSKIKKMGPEATINCPTPKPWEMPKAVQTKLARKAKTTIDPDAAQELVKRLGTNMSLLSSELETLKNLAQEPGHIRLQDVTDNVVRIVEPTPWDLADAMCERNLKKSLELLAQMRTSVGPGTIAYLTGRVKELICAKSLEERGESSALASELHKQSWQVKNYTRWARKFSREELVAALKACAQTDRAIKSGSDVRNTLITLLANICGEPSQITYNC